MKKILVSLMLLGSASTVMAADSTSGLYLKGSLGDSILHAGNTRNTFSQDIALGYDLQPATGLPLRTDLGYTFRNKKTAGGRIHADSLLLNGYYDFATGSAFTPYVNLGLGSSFNKVDGEKTNRFAWDIGTGVGYDLAENLKLDASARYVRLGKVSSEEVNSVDLMLGARYEF